MAREKIEVRYKKLGPGAYHKYIIYTDSSGTEHIARGGPESWYNEDFEAKYNDWLGDLECEIGPYVEGHIDFPEEGEIHPSEIIAEGRNLGPKWASIADTTARINADTNWCFENLSIRNAIWLSVSLTNSNTAAQS